MKTRFCQKITPYGLAGLFNKAYVRVSTLEKATKGFERSGNPRPTIIVDGEPAIQISVASDDEYTATLSAAHPSASNSTSANLTSPIPATSPHTSDTNPSRHPTTNIGILKSTIPPSFGSLQNVTFRKRTTVSVADVSPIPGPSNATCKNPLTKRRKTTKKRLEILKASPIKERLEEAERRRSLKLTKTPKTLRKPFKRKQVKKALFDSSSSDCEDNNICNDKSDNVFFLCSGKSNTTKEVFCMQ
ncbi:hypothetical protein ILUMI_04705 [Ignelater luminosus]|uniref:Uncharacterized protein n=1 Tax=Ignelater luminosus TaxID=2038154 RepID=A0A8K0DJ77_IGNLU|nr:hypothetical protein ILUMI_04705 [Ignelater luminosus]